MTVSGWLSRSGVAAVCVIKVNPSFFYYGRASQLWQGAPFEINCNLKDIERTSRLLLTHNGAKRKRNIFHYPDEPSRSPAP
jgi:hypothetical protein